MALIGVGGMARSHIRQMLQMPETTKIVAVCEVDEKQYDLSAKLFEENWLKPPPNQPNLYQLLRNYRGELDAPLSSPHMPTTTIRQLPAWRPGWMCRWKSLW